MCVSLSLSRFKFVRSLEYVCFDERELKRANEQFIQFIVSGMPFAYATVLFSTTSGLYGVRYI